MIPFPFNENRFSFFVADHLLVDQFCTNPKSDRSLLSCLKSTQCSTSEIGDVPLYNRTIASTLKMQSWIATNNRDVSRVKKTKFPATVIVFGVVSNKGYIMPPHIFEVGLKVNTKMYLDVLKNVVIPWCNQVASGRPWVWQRDSTPAHKSTETQLGFRKSATTVYPSLTGTSPPPTWTHFVWSYVKNITKINCHDTKASLIAAICRVFAELPPVLVENACSQLQIHIKAVIEAEGSYIE